MKNVIKDIDIEVQVVHYFCGWQLQTNAPWLHVIHKAKLEFTSYSVEGSNNPSSSRESLHEYIKLQPYIRQLWSIIGI